MCGIIGYSGGRQVSEVLVEGLTKLEYRGYDSAGIAVMRGDGEVAVRKCKGRIAALEKLLDEEGGLDGSCGVGHTRWATHGEPNDINAHPHAGGRVALIHNGIIENYMELRRKLQRKGYTFDSQTDSEVAAKLVDYCYGEGVSPLSAIAAAAGQMRGSFAFALLFKGAEGVIYAARRGSPLIIGLGEGENFLASDIPAILKYTRNYYILEENEIAAVSADGVSVYDADLAEVKKELMTATWDVEAAEKGGYPHFMLKEIMEQPRALRDTISPRVQNGKVVFEDAELLPRLKKAERIFIVACGTAMYAGTAGRYAIEQLARIPVTVDAASEFRYRDPVIGARDSVIIISQSGETADTLAALRLAKSKGAFVVGIVNVVGSSIAREADCALITAAGPEISVASTKAYSVQVAMLMLLASGLSGDGITADLLKLPEQVEKITESENIEHYQYVASKYQNAKHIFYIGRNLDYALSMEGALKLKELAYTHSEAYAAGELKHGPIALIEKGTPVIAAATQNRLFEKTASNIKEVLARGAKVLLICQKGHGDLEELCEDVCELPEVPDILAPMLGIVPLQLFAYYTAVLKGCDVDKPRNLAKSVTVE